MKAKTKTQPRRAKLDTATVVQAAVELIEAEGLEALSLGRLAKELDVQTPSLYNHIDGLPGLYRELALRSTRELGEVMGNAAIGKSGAGAVLALAEAYRALGKKEEAIRALESCKLLVEDADFRAQIDSYINQIKNQ